MSASNTPNGDPPAHTQLQSPAPHDPDAPDNRRLSIALPKAAPAPSIRDASSVAQVRAALATLHQREASLTSRLDSLLASQDTLSRDLARLDLLRANLGSQVIATRSITNSMLAPAADTAGHLSNRVKDLDLEKDRVHQTLRVVEQVAELKACVHGVVGSMGAPQDWEAAAGYLSRAARIPETIARGQFAASIVPSVEVPDAPWVTLESAKESLCGLFLREFDKAAQEQDGAKVTRFFKLFPLIGRGDVGLDVYGRYVCQGVAGTARATLKDASAPIPAAGGGRKDGFFYANALTKLFEHIAQIVEGHGGLVERHYGEGKMVKVIERLQMEADVQGGIILDSWSDERTVDRRLTDVKSYPFSFLVQSFVQHPRGITGAPRMNSPAMGGGTNPRTSEDEGVNMKEVDGLLNEIAIMLGRWSLYSKFLAGKCQSPSAPEDAELLLPELLTKSNFSRKVSARLVTPYNVMSTFFFRRSVEKAFQLDESPSGLSLNMQKPLDGNAPYIISAVDDVMYIVSTVLQKSMSTSQREVVASVIPTVSRVLGADFIGMIQRKMRDESYPRPAIQGQLPPEDKIVPFIVLINSLEISNDYLSRIIDARLGSPTEEQQVNGASSPDLLAQSFPFEQDAKFVTKTLNALNSSFTTQASELMSDGLTVLFNQVVKLRLRRVLQNTFSDADYSLTEEELAEVAAANDEDEDAMLDAVPRRFEAEWDAVMRPIGRLMTPRAFTSLMDTTARHLARVLEKRVWSYVGRANGYGAVRMERDFSGIISALARGSHYGVRELFARVAQILMVGNMEADEWEELLTEMEDEKERRARDGTLGDDDELAGIRWVLSEDERRKARGLVRE